VTIHNGGRAGEWVFADPRRNYNSTVTLADQNSQITAGKVTLPVPLPSATTGGPYFPYYLVPTLTSQLNAVGRRPGEHG